MPYGSGHPDVEMSGEDFVYNGEQLKKQKEVFCAAVEISSCRESTTCGKMLEKLYSGEWANLNHLEGKILAKEQHRVMGKTDCRK